VFLIAIVGLKEQVWRQVETENNCLHDHIEKIGSPAEQNLDSSIVQKSDAIKYQRKTDQRKSSARKILAKCYCDCESRWDGPFSEVPNKFKIQ
jgi:hypothetical protein